jgi:hypothetical protein
MLDTANPSGQSDALAVQAVSAPGVVPVKAVGSATTSSHTVDGTTGMAWGSDSASAGVAVPLRCASCHDPHGNGNYRVLKTLPNTSGTATPLAIADGVNKVYWNVDDTNAPSYIANVSAWCSSCHTRYLATEGSAGRPSGNAIYQYRHNSDGKTQGNKGCIQCHVSHGSNASVGATSGSVDNPDGTSALHDSKLLRIDNRGTCTMCHNR